MRALQFSSVIYIRAEASQMKNKVKSCTLVPDYVKKKMTGNGGEVEGEEEECPQLVPVTSPPNSRQSCLYIHKCCGTGTVTFALA
jgi:hypothetical protein